MSGASESLRTSYWSLVSYIQRKQLNIVNLRNRVSSILWLSGHRSCYLPVLQIYRFKIFIYFSSPKRKKGTYFMMNYYLIHIICLDNLRLVFWKCGTNKRTRRNRKKEITARNIMNNCKKKYSQGLKLVC